MPCNLGSFHSGGLVQDCGNSSAYALELPQFCTKPSISSFPVNIPPARWWVCDVRWSVFVPDVPVMLSIYIFLDGAFLLYAITLWNKSMAAYLVGVSRVAFWELTYKLYSDGLRLCVVLYIVLRFVLVLYKCNIMSWLICIPDLVTGWDRIMECQIKNIIVVGVLFNKTTIKLWRFIIVDLGRKRSLQFWWFVL